MTHAKRRLAVLLAAVGFAVLVASGVALAENRVGTDGNDTIRGTGEDDNLLGRGGNDTIYGLGGGDTVGGEEDDDELYGGDGNDRVVGASGSDQISGGEGSDDLAGENGSDTVRGDAGADLIAGGTGADDLRGGDANDTIGAVDGRSDTISCGSGFDRVKVDPEDTVATDCESILTIASDTDTRLKGSYERNGQRISFNSGAVSGGGTLDGGRPYDRQVTSEVTVNGITLTADMNPENRMLKTTSSDGALETANKGLTQAAGEEIIDFLDVKSLDSARNHKALLLRSLSYYSEAPKGFKFESNGRETFPSKKNDNSPPPRDGEPHSTTASGEFQASAIVDTPDQDGIVLVPGDSFVNHSHDAVDHNIVTYGVSTANDQGRCGPAGTIFQSSEYTQDCLDHDYCGIAHGSETGPFDANCGDEFLEAGDDFYILNNPNRTFSSGSSSAGTSTYRTPVESEQSSSA